MTMPARDFRGYGPTPPNPRWPGEARIAININLNFEAGGERSMLEGDGTSENMLTDTGFPAYPGKRSQIVESVFEYGPRAGNWRVLRILKEFEVKVSVLGVVRALQQNPDAVEAFIADGHEIVSHGYRWIDYQYVPAEIEREHMAKAIEIHKRLTGTRPLGWYQGRTSPQTAALVVEDGGFVYDADSYADDVPYWDRSHGAPQLIVPYTLDANDMKFVALNGFTHGDQFFAYLRDTFDQLREEGGRMMSIGLHARIAGRPARARAVAKFIDHVLASGDAWIARRIDIARHWQEAYPA